MNVEIVNAAGVDALFHMVGICALIMSDVSDEELEHMIDDVGRAEDLLPPEMREVCGDDRNPGEVFRTILPALLLAEQRRRHGSH